MDFRGALLKAGYIWVQPYVSRIIPEKFSSYKGIKFVKSYITPLGEFKVLLIHYQKDLTKLPFAFVIEKPIELTGISLPHISNSGYLCYANNDQAEWNPLDAEYFAKAIDNSIAKTLLVATENINESSEYQNEFSNYWEGDSTAYSFEEFPTATKNLRYSSLISKRGKNKRDSTEYVIFTEDENRNNWLKLREQATVIEDGTVVVVTVKRNNWAPVSSWPPSSLDEVVAWLARADRSAHDFLIFQLVRFSAKRLLVILQISEEGQLAFKLTFSKRYQSLLEQWRSRKKKSLKSMLAPICSPKATTSFIRLRVEAVDPNSIFLRNRPDPKVGDLRNKRIALVGCGTIGSFIAELLVKSGAGAGARGRLEVYDPDILKSGNLGRHRLSARFLGWNKAEGITKLIEDDSLHKVSIYAHDEDFEISTDNLKKYDILIDATGRVPVSLALAGFVRKMPSSRPILIHGFNHHWGQDSVAFIDNGKACYGCLARFTTTKSKTETANTSRYSCGSLYTPYDASVSVVSAALTVEAVLNTLEPKLKWTYTKVTSNIKQSQKRLSLKPLSSCKVCGQGTIR
ncbi:MAG: ThiF family adenylyltransferase [Gammaproteobacteria bacterium]|nr:ThiF family adenylyltransferase [Gammaproteobacteria bacterium]MBU1556375.1 ThiF family adenylyltransferase [Gammaproteobacteria bacterium]MBU2068989.1 ThiF family adenylyltransferase [Gammaproteobacteria bacterium]MBU2183212.1 ThiF family adenylyltransferase [Gammaproteobacteria bacterium]MBU2204592.1 ThiF family adenylyltransferase [Gammaproteobacteria bacterium]